MLRLLLINATLLLLSSIAVGEESEDSTEQEAPATEERGDGIEKPKTMSGMSILGNEEAPKSLVIIPWKSSELGEDISLSDTLDDRERLTLKTEPIGIEPMSQQGSFADIEQVTGRRILHAGAGVHELACLARVERGHENATAFNNTVCQPKDVRYKVAAIR